MRRHYNDLWEYDSECGGLFQDRFCQYPAPYITISPQKDYNILFPSRCPKCKGIFNKAERIRNKP